MTGSRYRKIHCMIWNDDKFPFLSDAAKLVFFHLLTTPCSSPFGYFKAGKASLLEESRMDAKGFAKGFQEGFEKGLFKYNERALTILLPKFLHHNKPANPNVVKMWGKIFAELPACSLKEESFTAIKICCEELGKPFAEAFHIAFGKEYANTVAVTVTVTGELPVDTTVIDDQPEKPLLCPHKEIIELYHSMLPELDGVKINLWDGQRRNDLRTRWKEDEVRQNLEWWKSFFKEVSDSDFLMGRKKDWKANLGWLVRRSNFIKTLEGQYQNRDGNGKTATPLSQEQKLSTCDYNQDKNDICRNIVNNGPEYCKGCSAFRMAAKYQ